MRLPQNNRLPEVVKDYRLALHETQFQFAKRFGLDSATAVSLWEAGKRQIPTNVLMEVLKLELPKFEVCTNCNGVGLLISSNPTGEHQK